MGWGEHRQVDVDARITLIRDVIVLHHRGDITGAAAASAVEQIIPSLLAHLTGHEPDADPTLPSWLAREVTRLSNSKGRRRRV